MWFERIRSHSFGPFQDEVLTFTRGLNLIYGPNEAGKSSWHAALFAGLCGRRRGPGKRLAEKEFEERHRPWEAQDWRVDLTLRLADGRRVNLVQNLETHTGAAKDTVLGRDYSDQILFEGAPDGSTWLGLNREVFPAVACVGQGQLLDILKEPESLQEHLQRAADTFGVEGTAAEALKLIQDFQRTRVGSTRSNSRRPLRLAMDAVETAKGQFDVAGGQHSEFTELMNKVTLKRREVNTIRQDTRRAEALLARAEAEKARLRLEKAVRLAESHGFESEAAILDDLRGRRGDVEARIVEMQNRKTRYGRLGGAGLVLLLAGVAGSAMGVDLGWGLAGVVPGAGALLVFWFGSRRVLAEESEFRSRQLELERLETVLDGQSLQQLREGVRELEERVREMDPVARQAVEPDLKEGLERLRQREKEESNRLIRLETQLAERQKSILSPAECEEALEGARAELQRLRRLGRDLDRTADLLRKAEEQVHRDIAPYISEVIGRWLPGVTAGRYRDARVDPESLIVEVQAESGAWRKATRLSHGTAEQIYLLLRVALVQYLTKPEEICPLILDDVTVQSDSTRTRAVLDALLALAGERQVILFSQEDEVLEWAREKLVGPAHRLVLLESIR